ncbi:hypothetical protein HU200_052449 [Digitaria exilis]|uniref:Uncharacterized protein n=1 Tax=Digitaria exilis TaxID=1010633 RepID=A0A835ANT7_9POAL|nr:hypothetical protein HU200_052449 [Digitaria exilis]
MALTAKAYGVSSLGVTGDGMDQLEVVGTGLDFICLVQCLRKKIGYADLLKVEEVKARDTRAVVVNTQGAQPAYYEPANNDVRRRSGIQSIITKLMKFMWPHDDDIGGTSSPPPSSPPPLRVEHMANRPPPE